MKILFYGLVFLNVFCLTVNLINADWLYVVFSGIGTYFSIINVKSLSN